MVPIEYFNYARLTFFFLSTTCLFVTLLCGLPFKLVAPSLWRAWSDYCKGLFGKLLVYVAHSTSPAKIRLYSNEQFYVNQHEQSGEQILDLALSPRAVLMMNHQLYCDWVFLWYLSYTSCLQSAPVIALKKSLKKIPIFGWGMSFFRFLFLSRKWEDDKQTIKENTAYFAKDRNTPLWMTIFPEGTVFNGNTKSNARKFLAAQNKEDLMLNDVLYPRGKGLQAILQGLKGTVPVVYDITVVYEPVPPGGHNDVEVFYGLGRSFIEGKGPQTVKMHIRQIPIHAVPYKESHEVFMDWLYKQWQTKDAVYQKLVDNSLESELRGEGVIRLQSNLELLECFVFPGLMLLLYRIYRLFFK